MKSTDITETPREFFNEQNKRFNFNFDAAATHANALCDMYATEDGVFNRGHQVSAAHGLECLWAGLRVWCNPPYSDIWPWIVKAWQSQAKLVYMLLPNNRSDQQWWHDWIEPWRDGKQLTPGLSLTTENYPGRLHFTRDGGKPILNSQGKRGSPSFGQTALIWRKV
jgi:hypothetical protein